MRMRLLVLLSMAACGGLPDKEGFTPGASVSSASLEAQGARVHYMRGLKPSKPGGGGSTNLVDHGGRVLPTSKNYAIYWGTNQAALPSDLSAGVSAFFNGITGTSYATIGTQYMRGGGAQVSSLAGSATDTTSASPTSGPSTSAVVSEACKVINANAWTADPTAIYFLFADNMPSGTNYCAYHTWGTCNGVSIQVSYMPNTTGVAGCDPGDLYGCNTYSQGTRSIVNVTSHEWYEAVTDAQGNAWYDQHGSEIGDKCAWTFSSCVNLSSSKWQLQQEWSNAVSGCVQQ